MVREHLDTSLPRIVVLLDNRAGAHPRLTDGVAETFESACEAAASVVAAARREDLPVTLLLVAGADVGGDFLDRLAAAELHAGPRGGSADRPRDGSPDRAHGGSVERPGGGSADGPGDGPHRVVSAADEASTAGAALRTATSRLRQERLGDTLVFLTGPGAQADLGYLGGLRGAYPSVIVGIFGADGQMPPATAGLVVIDADDGADFAARWDEVRRW
jgi:hypothetical protein